MLGGANVYGGAMSIHRLADVNDGEGRVLDFTAARAARSGDEPWLSKKQIAEHLGYSERWVDYRIRDGLPCKRLGNRWRFRRSEVETWLSDRGGSAA
jgi:excisionase family DNA binding protein